MPEITMPRLSDTMEDGVIASWLKQVGDPVARGEVLAEIETDKALMELEAYDDGVLEQILADAGARVPIGEPIAIVGDGSGAVSATSAPAGNPGSGSATSGSTGAAGSGSSGAEGNSTTGQDSPAAATAAAGRPKSSPLARKVARELGVDLAAVTGTGPGGRITRQDVESAHRTGGFAAGGSGAALDPGTSGDGYDGVGAGTGGSAPLPSGDYDEVPLSRIQQVSATRLAQSMQQAPHIYLTSAIDVTDLLAFRADVNATLEAAGKGKVSVNDLLVKAVASTLRADPAVNVSFAGDKLLRRNGIHLGIAVATPAGLLVPVIRDADRKSVSEIGAEARELAGRARDRKLRAEEMSGGTFTISNLGMFGVEQFTAVINPPESAILAVGAAQDELRLDGDAVVARKILRITMSADHRAIDGAVAAKFLQQLKDLLEHPLRIVA
ncbi:dihydrolipoamide acetyltransferase family protein [Nocardia thraciensis]